jgi:hypothetical protein
MTKISPAKIAEASRRYNARKTSQSPVQPAGIAPGIAPLCEHAGEGIACNTRRCEVGHGEPTGIRVCHHCGPSRCADYLPQNTIADERFIPKPTDVRCGVVVGVFRWPELAELQINLIRKKCGPVPILISNDQPEAHEQLAGICERLRADLITSPERIGHTGGDVAAFHRGIVWARNLGLQAVAKLSQRFLVNRFRWLQDSASDLLTSGLPLASLPCRGRSVFDLRTEAVLLNVAEWSRFDVLTMIEPKRYHEGRLNGVYAETVIWRALQSIGGLYWPWYSVLGCEDRERRVHSDVIWHNHNSVDDYRRFAESLGVTLSAGFTVAGWEQEQKQGRYLYG